MGRPEQMVTYIPLRIRALPSPAGQKARLSRTVGQRKLVKDFKWRPLTSPNFKNFIFVCSRAQDSFISSSFCFSPYRLCPITIPRDSISAFWLRVLKVWSASGTTEADSKPPSKTQEPPASGCRLGGGGSTVIHWGCHSNSSWPPPQLFLLVWTLQRTAHTSV